MPANNGVMFIPITLGSDKMTVSVGTGAMSFGLYMVQ